MYKLGTALGAVPACLLLSMTLSAQPALKFTGCPDITRGDFQKTLLVTRGGHQIDEPIQMAIDKGGRIFWVQRRGQVRAWNPADNQAKTLLDLTARLFTGTTNQIEHGISGIALDPGFETNKWVFVYWAVKDPKMFRLSRFTLNGDVLGSEQVILDIPYTNTGCCHTAGSMAFDFSGNLWMAVGNTTNNGSGVGSKDPEVATNYVNEADAHGDDQRGAANTNSLLGKIIRIKPKAIPTGTAAVAPGAGTTYDIPAGNLFPVGQYPADKTRPEIYTMGHRNPYSISLDPYRNWLTWGEIGPDEFAASDTVKTEEHNLVTKPGFMGWPYFVGRNQRFRLKKDPARSTNTSRHNTGLTDLLPAQPALHPYGHAAAVTGPIYYYDGRLPSRTKLPPHFNKKWLYSDFNGGYIEAATVNEQGTAMTSDGKFWADGFLVRPLDMEIGPDGNLYVLEYSGWFGPGSDTRIARVDYKGACLPQDILPPSVGLAGSPAPKGNIQGTVLRWLGRGSLRLPAGTRSFQVFDLGGRRVFASSAPASGDGRASGDGWAALPPGLRAGVYRVAFRP